MRRLTRIEVLEGYRLGVTFDDGVSGVIDLSSLVGSGVFDVWRDPSVFAAVRIGSSGEAVWNDRVDLCPDSLYLKVTGKKPEDVFPCLRPGKTRA